MALKTIIENLNSARREYESQLAAIGKDAQKGIAEYLAPFIPPGYAVFWTQYTPYFNDGEACRFSVHDAYLVRTENLGEVRKSYQAEENGLSFYQAKERYGCPDVEKSYQTDDRSKPTLPPQPGDSPWNRRYPQKTVTYIEPGFPAIEGYEASKLDELSKAWNALGQDLLEQAFGDHVSCAVMSTGEVLVRECEHD